MAEGGRGRREVREEATKSYVHTPTEDAREMQETMEIELYNVTFKVKTWTQLNLEYLLEHGDNTIMLPSGKLQMKLQDPFAIVHITKRGIVQGIGGCLSEMAGAYTALRVLMFLKDAGYHIRAHGFRFVNVHAGARVPFRIDIKSMLEHNKKQMEQIHTTEDTGQPKLKTFIHSVGTTFIIAHSGHLCIFGPSVEKLLQGCKFIYPHLRYWAILPKPMPLDPKPRDSNKLKKQTH